MKPQEDGHSSLAYVLVTVYWPSLYCAALDSLHTLAKLPQTPTITAELQDSFTFSSLGFLKLGTACSSYPGRTFRKLVAFHKRANGFELKILPILTLKWNTCSFVSSLDFEI